MNGMDVREKLVELLEPHMSGLACEYESGSCELTSCRSCNAKNIADHLIANGVTVQERACWKYIEDDIDEGNNIKAYRRLTMANEKRLIDANALIEEAYAEGAYGYVDAKQIADAPTVDAVEVVRCRQCKHCDPENHHCDHHMGTVAPLRREPDDFCSYGERKDGDGNG